MYDKKYFDAIGNECFEHLRAVNPSGGMKEFIRMAVEFGYKKALQEEDKKRRRFNLLKRIKRWRTEPCS